MEKIIKNKQWDPESMHLAVDMCLNGECSIYAAAKQFHVPRTTLTQRVHGKGERNALTGRPTALTVQEEQSLVNYVKYMHQIRFPVDRSQIISIA